jgi:aminoglycoside/choline kinase family phosphotransferase
MSSVQTPLALEVSKLLPGGVSCRVEPLGGDGSVRHFFRVITAQTTYILFIGPDPLENGAYLRIAAHLGNCGVRVPRVHGYEKSQGWVVVEDLGDVNLLDVVAMARAENPQADDALVALYAPVVELLCRVQVAGAREFTLETGFAPAPYGPDFMVEREGLYFLEELVRGVLGYEVEDRELLPELTKLAAQAARAPGGYFQHRDFQSRNLHRVPEGWAVIDFQDARPGPLAYDAAALILDPYAALPGAVREELFQLYLKELATYDGVDVAAVRDSWMPMGSFRLLQALGAFGKLGWRFGKPGFLEHVADGLEHLENQLGEEGRRDYPLLTGLVSRCRQGWAEKLAHGLSDRPAPGA